jgi:hypothetical protein
MTFIRKVLQAWEAIAQELLGTNQWPRNADLRGIDASEDAIGDGNAICFKTLLSMRIRYNPLLIIIYTSTNAVWIPTAKHGSLIRC